MLSDIVAAAVELSEWEVYFVDSSSLEINSINLQLLVRHLFYIAVEPGSDCSLDVTPYQCTGLDNSECSTNNQCKCKTGFSHYSSDKSCSPGMIIYITGCLLA